MQELTIFNKKFAEFEDRLSTVEERLQNCAPNDSDQSRVQSQDLASEVQAVRTEARESMLLSNDNEQYSRRNNLRIFGLKPDVDEDCRQAVVFVTSTLRVSVNESEIELAHLTSGIQSSDGQSRRPVGLMLVRFCRKDMRDEVIKSRRILKGTRYAVTEDLTALNIKTMTRLRNHEHVLSTWSWNGKIFAVLSNGKKVILFDPFSRLPIFSTVKHAVIDGK